MPEQEFNSTAAKFISSLVKSLQILCNGQVDFNESIELVGHINVRVDHKFKFDYIVDEQVSKEGEDSATTFLSNSYHSCPPARQPRKPAKSDLHQDVLFPDLPHQNIHGKSKQSKSNHDTLSHSHDLCGEDTLASKDDNNSDFSVVAESQNRSSSQANQMVVKLEGDDDSTDCMVLPASPDYEPAGDVSVEGFPSAGPSASFEESHVNQISRARKRRQIDDQGTPTDDVSILRPVEDGMQLRSSTLKTKKSSKTIEVNSDIQNELIKSPDFANPISDIKQLISKLAAFCDMTVVQDELLIGAPRATSIPSGDDIKSAKKKFLKNFDRERLKKMKEVLKMKKGKQKKQQLRSLLAESGFSNEQLLLLAQDTNVRRKRISWRSIPEGPRKEAMMKEHRKSVRVKTQERQQKLLEMAEMLKRNQTNDPGFTVVSKTGAKKCVLHKSSVSVVSHSTQQLSLENINEVAEALSGKTKKILVQPNSQDKSKNQMKLEYSRRTCIKKKMKQIIAKILTEVSDAGYRVVVTSTIGSEAGSHSAELSVVPIKVDDFIPETKESDVKPELTEEEYAKQLEREQILEKQQANEEKMKETEMKLIRILTGAEEIFIPTRKRYNKGEPRPSDAERMKEYRKKLKQDPEKYQMYKQKRAINKKRRRLSELAAKVKVSTSGPSVTVIPANPVNEEPHGSQPMSTLVSITQPVGGVSMHCPQVYEHPSSHQNTASVVSVHHTTQYVGQVSGIHATHSHQQPIAYGNDMDIVELIAATHSVQNQHFG